MTIARRDRVRAKVRERYALIARRGKGGCAGTSSCCSPGATPATSLAAKLGYSPADLASVPAGANLGLGCGNPQAVAALKKGEVVLDLGAGGGFDAFLAARKVGPRGRVIGVDMTPEMVTRARQNAKKGRFRNVEFRLGEMEHLPVSDSSVDVIISNCVINLSVDKAQVYREAFRVLKPGGRLAITDVVSVRPLPAAFRRDLEKHAGCVAGAISARRTRALLKAAGFREVAVHVRPESAEFIRSWFPGSGVERYVRSADIQAAKPRRVRS